MAIVCECCGIKMNLTEWHEHLLNFHDQRDVMNCKACSGHIGAVDDLLEHLDRAHLMNCDRCQYTTYVPEDIITHSQSHSNTVSARTFTFFTITPSSSTEELSGFESQPARVIRNEGKAGSIQPGPSSQSSSSGQQQSWYDEDIRDVEHYYTNTHKMPLVKKSPSFFEKIFQRRKGYKRLKEEEEHTEMVLQEPGIGHHQVVPDLSRSIKKLLEKAGDVDRAIVATHLRLHQNDSWERGWGCGYRNLQTLVDSISCNAELAAGSGLDRIPSFGEIQRILEDAWQAGFDPDGAKGLDYSLFGTDKWIGASDIATFLQYRHLQTHLIDITMLPNVQEMQMVFTNFVYNYYTTTAEPLTIFFQEAGHSRSIIGVVETAFGPNLLVYDPLHNVEDILATIYSQDAQRLASYLRWRPQRLTAEFYQLVIVKGVTADAAVLDMNRNFEFGFNTFEINPLHEMNAQYEWPERVR